ncbi:tyrosine-protein phosphatase [Curtobacterium ammoniigenes]|uniref:tyrosine-protein phosphatase n=1 Tax=Curtobacterium ammoniigenes TaxID=395387 RepID=UPI0008329607|nr:tyrosine-protein phosphatase [Curtobacterium ammoniigenes]
MTYVVLVRHLDWDGYLNARDLGGLPTPLSDTGATLFGRVARGPRRELLTESGWRDARAWGLAAVVDLRCAYEVGVRDGDPTVDPEAFAGVRVANAPTEDQDDPEFREICFPILDSPEYWRHNWRILPHLVLATLHAIADAPDGVLVHCSAGRDRTGMISALLLSNAGVAPSAVAADYAESVRAMAGGKAHAPNDRQADWGTNEANDWIAATAPIVEDAAADVDAAFATIGASSDLRSRLRARLTE